MEKNGEKEKRCIGQIKEELNALDETIHNGEAFHLR